MLSMTCVENNRIVLCSDENMTFKIMYINVYECERFTLQKMHK